MKKLNKSYLMWALVAIIIIGAAWWWMSMGENSYQAGTPIAGVVPAATQQLPPDTINNLSDPSLGKYLVTLNGMTLYRYTKDTANISTCYDQCALAWPPYIAPDSAITKSLDLTGTLTMIVRTDGSKQLAYNGSPLYFWSKDKKSGDVTGQNFGGVWFVINP